MLAYLVYHRGAPFRAGFLPALLSAPLPARSEAHEKGHFRGLVSFPALQSIRRILCTRLREAMIISLAWQLLARSVIGSILSNLTDESSGGVPRLMEPRAVLCTQILLAAPRVCRDPAPSEVLLQHLLS